MNDKTNTTSEIDDTEGHGYPAGIQIARSANVTKGEAEHGSAVAGDGDDTEGNCFKYRDGHPVGRPDDTEGHAVKTSPVEPESDAINGRGKRGPG